MVHVDPRLGPLRIFLRPRLIILKMLFKELVENHIAKHTRVVRLFPHYFDHEASERVGALVRKEELKILTGFKKEKSLGSDGWTVEFYLKKFEFLGNDMVRVVGNLGS